MSGFADDEAQRTSVEMLKHESASAMVTMLASPHYAAARLVDISQDEDAETLVLDVDVDLGQAPVVNDIRPTERVALRFLPDTLVPVAFPCRSDFPQDVPHLNIARSGEPRSFCLYDAATEDVVRLYSPHRYLERLRWWLLETAYGTLHGADQPLDPLFMRAGGAIILPPRWNRRENDIYAAFPSDEVSGAPLALRSFQPKQRRKNLRYWASVMIEAETAVPRSLAMLPTTYGELLRSHIAAGVNILPSLQKALRAWTSREDARELINDPLLTVVSVPLSRDGQKIEAVSTRGFVAYKNRAREIAAALRAFDVVDEHIAPMILVTEPDYAALDQIELLPVDVYDGFDRATGQGASGRPSPDLRRICLLGAGALGSQVALAAARGGTGIWDIVDKDFLLPHNLARHGLSSAHQGGSKATGLAYEVAHLLGPESARGLVFDVFEASEQLISEILPAADMVVDATASVMVSRMLAFTDTKAPAVSCFLNPAGRDLVMLVEDQARSTRLDHLEMEYYWALVAEPELAGHLSDRTGVVPTGSCRRASVQLPQTRMGMFASIAAEAILGQPAGERGRIRIWRQNAETLGIFPLTLEGESFHDRELLGWKVVVRPDLMRKIVSARKEANDVETGGILIGHWDRLNKRLYLVGAFDAPPDSQHQRSGFIRGAMGVYKSILDVEHATASNLTYVGEWHTHPPQHSSRPSHDDGRLLRWIADAMTLSDAPAGMLIVGDDGIRCILEVQGNRQETVISIEQG